MICQWGFEGKKTPPPPPPNFCLNISLGEGGAKSSFHYSAIEPLIPKLSTEVSNNHDEIWTSSVIFT